MFCVGFLVGGGGDDDGAFSRGLFCRNKIV